ncbi:MBL fold metallo-hydrolase [Deinococcus yavapaiensis]|uniref:Glyoxylase-like metal-dependent hydrolase (Beta-lactamase superfamily II) n=1 Tax=Deinococcus yavapaiensis KR-236 TaxID=694435 RepID=A0A318SAJ0_9DEIO|nr:MBL fold metallo-hydrolase [Deinococcus yavapaiensis]PYE55889.1 glyoxylase-like metal-dependent hydrolase (beta-lactamase superfamily II) [Deinococcus yavapaiensis KR-236]
MTGFSHASTTARHGGVTVEWIVTGPVQENVVLVYDDEKRGFLIDPGDEASKIRARLQALEFQPSAILLTHAHFDHVGAVEALRGILEVPVLAHADGLELYRAAASSAARFGLSMTQPSDPDGELREGEALAAGDVKLRVRSLPGHAPGHVVFVGDGFVVAGDTLFRGSIGRTDLPGGDHALLLKGIERQLFSLPDETRVYPGHGPSTTVGVEKRSNPYLQ